MHQIFPDSTLVPLLQKLVANGLIYNVYEDGAPALTRDTVLGDLSGFFSGVFAPTTVAAGDFTLTGVTAHVASLVAPFISIPSTASTDKLIQGYVVTDAVTGAMVMAAEFDGAPVTIHVGGEITILPCVYTSSVFSS